MSSAFPSNANPEPRGRPGAPEKPVKNIKRVTTTAPTERKTPLGTKFKQTFFGGEFKGVMSNTLWEVLIPGARDVANDAIDAAKARVLYGDSAAGRRMHSSRPAAGGRGYVSYGGMGARPAPSSSAPTRPSSAEKVATKSTFRYYTLDSRMEADMVVEQMYNILGKFDVVSVRDYKDLVGADAGHTDEKFGWTDLKGSTVRRVDGGYLVDVPMPGELND